MVALVLVAAACTVGGQIVLQPGRGSGIYVTNLLNRRVVRVNDMRG
jgi:hypothetical protein